MTDTSAHATLSPSAAHRWFECPGSIRLTADLPRTASPYAAEGTAAHTIAARCLIEETDPVVYLGEVLTVEGMEFTVTDSMCEAIQVFVDFVRSYTDKGYLLYVEVKLDLGHLWPGQFGTGDAVLYHMLTEHLVVVDFKYGAGVYVVAEENPQLLSYVSGAYHLREDFGITRIDGVIVQPRAGGEPVRSWSVTLERLEQFEAEFAAAAAITVLPDAPLKSGDWCKFCGAAGMCPELRKKSIANALVEFEIEAPAPVPLEPPKPIHLTSQELGLVLQQASLIEHWLEEVKREGLRRALAGEVPFGMKLVHKRTNRKWVDEAKATAMLTMIYDANPDEIWTRKLISPAAAEKLLGKGAKTTLANVVTKPDGDLQLALLSDKREQAPPDAVKAFEGLLMHQLEASVRAVDGAD